MKFFTMLNAVAPPRWLLSLLAAVGPDRGPGLGVARGRAQPAIGGCHRARGCNHRVCDCDLACLPHAGARIACCLSSACCPCGLRCVHPGERCGRRFRRCKAKPDEMRRDPALQTICQSRPARSRPLRMAQARPLPEFVRPAERPKADCAWQRAFVGRGGIRSRRSCDRHDEIRPAPAFRRRATADHGRSGGHACKAAGVPRAARPHRAGAGRLSLSDGRRLHCRKCARQEPIPRGLLRQYCRGADPLSSADAVSSPSIEKPTVPCSI